MAIYTKLSADSFLQWLIAKARYRNWAWLKLEALGHGDHIEGYDFGEERIIKANY